MKYNKIRVLILSSIILVAGAGCTSRTSPSSVVVVQPQATEVNYFVPKDIAEYMRIEEAYTAVGKETDPAYTVVYVMHATSTKSTEDSRRTAVQAALNLLPAGGGPPHANVAYFKIVGTTAYVLLDVDFDGWAGVSIYETAAHPVITYNLLMNSGISSVVFGPAPDDTMEQIRSTLNQQK
jgi:hypothetical protein